MSNKDNWHPSAQQPQPGPPPPQQPPMDPQQQQQGAGGPPQQPPPQQHRTLSYTPSQPPPGPVLPPPGMTPAGPTGFYGPQPPHQLPLPHPSHPAYPPLPGMQPGGPTHGPPPPQTAPGGPPQPQQSQQQQQQNQGPPQGPPNSHMPQAGPGQPLGMPPGLPAGMSQGPMMPQQNGPPPTTGPHMLSALNPGPPQNLSAPLQPSPILTPAQQQQQQQQQGSQMPQTTVNGLGGPILNDALSYLDQVKLQFAEQPDVYNKFLDIMKDFKSQAIDTPGVIERVSSLFCGHPDLIRGFNTFLPPGYMIECSDDPMDTSIRVTTPSGVTRATVGAGPPLGAILARDAMSQSRFFEQPGSRAWGDYRGYPPNGPAHVPTEPSSARQLQHQRLVEEHQANLAAQQAAAAAGASQLQNAAAATNGNGRSGPSSLGPGGPGAMEQKTGKAPVEFNHAISYVNKIKNRFSQQPEIYKNFLEILQTYQRESKPIQEVYSQVTQLFSSAPDLLEDFKQFLPESAAQAKAAAAARQAADEAAIANSSAIGGGPSGPGPGSRLPPVGNFAPPPSGVKEPKKKRGQPNPEPVAREVQPTPLGAGPLRTGVTNKRAKVTHPQPKPVTEAPAVSPTLTPYQPEPLGPPAKQPASQEELAFFDRVKKFIGNKQTYNEFLKLLNLFSQDLVDKNMMVTKVENFIGGNKELMEWFKRFVEYEGKDEVINNVPRSTNKVRLSVCRGLGPSYRLLPKVESSKQCRGRDEMCWEVLNDQWASHPTWASEDSGFVAHRKNQYEDTLHRIEEERHDYDFNIEANLRTIQLLEPIAQRIASMTSEEKAAFRLQPGLGGQSKTIYKRIIKKVYDKERGNEIVEALHNQPAVAVPIVLKRLKQKDEEWKLAQREWNKVWRETTAKVFWKSLDHQGITIKANDKKSYGHKALVAEIATKYKEQFNKRVTPTAPMPEYQFKYPFDLSVVLDACKLLAISLEHSSMVSIHDREKVDGFIKSFIPLFFGMSTKDVEDKVNNISRRTPEEEAEEFPSTPGDAPSVRTRRGGKREDDNLLRDVLKRGKTTKGSRKEKEGSVLSASKESTPEVGSVADEDTAMEGASSNHDATGKEDLIETWIKSPGPQRPGMAPGTPMEPDEPSLPRKRNVYTLFCNNTIYVFLRTFQILCGRLQDMKACEAEVCQDVQNRKGAQVARELGILISTPETYFRDTSPTANYYRQVVEHCEAFIQGELDAQTFEEGLRQMYCRKGWQLYTIDKLLAANLKLMQNIVQNDPKEKNGDILLLFQKDRQRKELVDGKRDCMALIDYRTKVEEMIPGEDPLYRFEWHEIPKEMTIQYLCRGEPTINDAITKEQKWNYYIQSYTMVTPTEGVDVESENYKVPFLKRNLNIAAAAAAAHQQYSQAPLSSVRDEPPSTATTSSSDAIVGPSGARTPREPVVELRSQAPLSPTSGTRLATTAAEGCLYSKHNLEIKVCVNTYKVFYKQGTEDFMVGKGWIHANSSNGTGRGGRVSKWKEYLETRVPWMKSLPEVEVDEIKRLWDERVKSGLVVASGDGEDDVEMGME